MDTDHIVSHTGYIFFSFLEVFRGTFYSHISTLTPKKRKGVELIGVWHWKLKAIQAEELGVLFLSSFVFRVKTD